MQFLVLVFFLVISAFTAAQAKPVDKVDSETLSPIGAAVSEGKSDDKDDKQDSKDKDKGKDAEEDPVTPEQQAALICQTADIMNNQVGAAYQPGVDVNGNAVAPADVDAEQVFEIPEQIEVPIQYDVMKALGVTPAQEGKATVGTLTVLKGGQLFYNGKDITNTIEGYCRKHVKEMDKKK